MIEINSEIELLTFLDAVDGFHDSLLHETVMLHPGYVAANRSMFGDAELPSLRMVFQSQFEDVQGVYVEFDEVSQFRWDCERSLAFEGEMPSAERIVIYPVGRSWRDDAVLVAKRMRYRLVGAAGLGPNYRMINEDCKFKG